MDTTQVSDLTNLNEKAGESSRKIRVLYLINQLVIGGATNVVLDLAGYFHIRTIMVPSLVNHISPLTNLRSILDLRKVIVQGKYDIVHTHTKVPGVLGRIAARMANTDLIVHHVHGWGAAEGMSRAVRMLHIGLERFCARFTDRIIVVAKPEIEKALRTELGRGSVSYTLRVRNEGPIAGLSDAADALAALNPRRIQRISSVPQQSSLRTMIKPNF